MSIHVERDMIAPIDRVWELTQTPEAHQRWDLRFTSIRYLPRTHDHEPQEFQYETRVGFGIRIHGTGSTRGERHLPDGTRASSLIFRSGHPLSLIREGRGFWKYTPTPSGTRFITCYDYETRWGLAGRLLDRVVFRPLMAWATAWSFDSLAHWAERGIPPETSRRLSIVTALVRLTLAGVWLNEGLVPKLLGPHPQEIALSLGASIPAAWVAGEILFLGCMELLLGLSLLVAWRRRWPAVISLLAMVPATAVGIYAAPDLRGAPFSCLLINSMTATLSLAAVLLASCVPSSANCRWSAFETNRHRAPMPSRKENPYALDL